MTQNPVPTGYLDTNIVSAIVKDYETESTALDQLLEFVNSGKLKVVTSDITREEADRCRAEDDKGKTIQRIARLMNKVTTLPKHKVIGFHNDYGRWGGISNPLVETDQRFARLRALGLDENDAHHVMVAINAGCEFFITSDQKTILKYRQKIESEFPIKLVKPSELLKMIDHFRSA